MTKSTEQFLFDKREAAKFLGCSVAHFDQKIRPLLKKIDLAKANATRPMPRWSRDDLVKFITSRQAA